MYELVQIGEKSYYFKSPAKIGLYLKNKKEAYIIDSGNDKDAGKKILKVLSEKGWVLRGILNTHSNADHIGGNQYIQKQTGCKIFQVVLKLHLLNIQYWNQPFYMGVIPVRI